MTELRTALDRQEAMEYRFGRPAYFSFRTPIEVEIRGFSEFKLGVAQTTSYLGKLLKLKDDLDDPDKRQIKVLLKDGAVTAPEPTFSSSAETDEAWQSRVQ